MPATRTSYDGHGQLLGMDDSIHAPYLPDTFAAKAVNRTFRGGLNQTRPRFASPRVIFEGENARDVERVKEIFENGNVQGVYPYTKTTKYRDAGLVFAIAGYLFFGRISGSGVIISQIYDGMDPKKLDVWFAQGQEHLYIQNGDTPLYWDGLPQNPVEEIVGDEKMPSGNIMAYSHGRIAVANEDNMIAVSDHLLGGTDRRNMENFSENTTFAGGFFTPPTDLGQITAMAALPVAGNRNGQGDLIIFCENGAASLDLSLPREQWRDAALIMVGAGGMSPYGAVPVNNDIWYRRQDGIGSLRQSRVDETSQWVDTPLSKEVSTWLLHDTPHLMRHASMSYFDNRVFCTVQGRIKTNSNDLYGSHRFFGGLTVLDLHRGSTVNEQSGFSWDGLWTGPRPTATTSIYADGVSRMFVMSFDSDEKNRLYEMKSTGGKDPNGRPIEGFYITKSFHSFGDTSDVFRQKKLTGGGQIRVVTGGKGTLSASTRADDYPCWTEYIPPIELGAENCNPSPNGDCKPVISGKYHDTIHAPTPDTETCEQGSNRTVGTGHSHQFKINTTGNITIPFASFGAVGIETSERTDCEARSGGSPISCCPEGDFDYFF